MSAVTAFKLCFKTLLSTRPVLQGNDMERSRNEHVLEPPLVVLGGSDTAVSGTAISVVMLDTSLMTSMQRSQVFF